VKSKSRVVVNYLGEGKWCPGRVAKENRNGTYFVEFDDGDALDDVLPVNIRLSRHSKKTAPLVFKLKSRVQVLVSATGEW